MIRETIERKASDWLFANRRRKWDLVEMGIKHGCAPIQLAGQFGAGKVILGSIILLAANHIKKSGIRPQ
jgi:hypothetical protein